MPSTRLLYTLTIFNCAIALGAWVRPPQSPAVQQVVRAKSIEVVNDRGEVRVQLFLDEEGSGQMRMRSGNGEVRMKLGGSAAGSALHLMDGSTEPGVSLWSGKAGTRIVLTKAGSPPRTIAP